MTAHQTEPVRPYPAEEPSQTPEPGPAPSRGRRAGRFLRLWYGRGLVGLAGLWLLYATVRWLVSGRWHWAIPLDAAPPLLLVATPAVLLSASAAACGRRRPWAAGVSLAALLLGLTTGSGLNWPALWRGEGAVPPGALHVVSLNTQYWGQATSVDRLYALLHRQKADVYLLQEHVIWKPGLGEDGYVKLDDDARLRAEFPGYHIARRGELLTLSRFPIVAKPPIGPGAEIDADPATPFSRVFARDKVMRTDLRVGGRILSVYNAHITVQLAPDNLNPFSGFDFDSYFHRKFTWRQEELRGLEKDLDDNPHPTVIAGDFNATASMRELDGLRARADDALRANDDFLPLSWKFNAPAGFEWDSVFNRSLPLWRVDWSFTAGPVDLHRYAFRPTDGISEHRMQDLWLSL
ncbi:endonuclease/exonuclease/phosphatase family protein [Streptomyces enissocaesilis]|uniref:Endonuclease/exonuclease/phosphatase family protein n=1 Tax=Streptomyces enissocaesilis TaxID=332589 RepID=A0ABP6JUB0_9ACTN